MTQPNQITTHTGFIIKHLGLVDYHVCWQAMKDFTANRTEQTNDEIWLLQHPAVYTQGIAGKPEHLLYDNNIPVIKTDRGGQITYHAPGQLIVYLLLDIRRLELGVRELVRKMENAVIDLLNDYHIEAKGRIEAPGVYVGEAKVAALGLRIRNGCSYHGLSLNVDMDLSPFSEIDPCGYPGLQVTQTRNLGIGDDIGTLGEKLLDILQSNLQDKTHEQ